MRFSQNDIIALRYTSTALFCTIDIPHTQTGQTIYDKQNQDIALLYEIV